jgi:hypothetical protein
MMLLLPADVLRPRRVDEHFAGEAQAARALGWPVALVDHDALSSGSDCAGAVARVPGDEVAIYRGWMLSSRAYDGLATALAARGTRLYTDAKQYRRVTNCPAGTPRCPRSPRRRRGPSAPAGTASMPPGPRWSRARPSYACRFSSDLSLLVFVACGSVVLSHRSAGGFASPICHLPRGVLLRVSCGWYRPRYRGASTAARRLAGSAWLKRRERGRGTGVRRAAVT